MHFSLGWTRSVLRYFLERRYGKKEPAAASDAADAPDATVVSSLEPPPVLFFNEEEREAFCEAHGLGRYRGGEVFPSGIGTSVQGGPQEQQQAVDNVIRGAQEQQQAVDNVQGAPQDVALAESLLRAAFACVSLGEEQYLLPLLEEVAR